jgi:hypothetical protein
MAELLAGWPVAEAQTTLSSKRATLNWRSSRSRSASTSTSLAPELRLLHQLRASLRRERARRHANINIRRGKEMNEYELGEAKK